MRGGLAGGLEVAEAGDFDEWTPENAGEAVFDEEVPDAVGFFVEAGHSEVGKDGAGLFRAAVPDGAEGEEGAVAPFITGGKLLGGHFGGTEDDMGGVIAAPIAVEEAVFGFELAEERSAWVGSEDVKGGALETVGFDPGNGAFENFGPIGIETENKAAVDLDAVIVQEADAAGVIFGARGAFARGVQVFIAKALEANENAGAARKSHGAHDFGMIRDIEGDGGAPDFVEGFKGVAEFEEVFGPGAEIVIDENGVGLAVLRELGNDLFHVAHFVGHV